MHEMVVLAPSSIGEVAVLAKRRGSDWFLASVNGAEARKITVSLRFLGSGAYSTTTASDVAGEPASVKMEKSTASRSTSLTIDLAAGGGFLGRFTPAR